MAGDAHTQTEAIREALDYGGDYMPTANARDRAKDALDALVARLEQLTDYVVSTPCPECGLPEPSRVGADCGQCAKARAALAADLCGDDRCKHPKGWHRFGTGACLECGCIEFAAAGSSANPAESEPRCSNTACRRKLHGFRGPLCRYCDPNAVCE